MQRSRVLWIVVAGPLVLCAACDSRDVRTTEAASGLPAAPPTQLPVGVAADSNLGLVHALKDAETRAPGRRPPECFDERTIGAVLDVIREKMLPGEAYRRMSKEDFDDQVAIRAARATAWDKGIAQYECVGTVIVDASAGADRLGRAVLTYPQLLHGAGSSVAEVERVLQSDMSPDRQRFSYSITRGTFCRARRTQPSRWGGGLSAGDAARRSRRFRPLA